MIRSSLLLHPCDIFLTMSIDATSSSSEQAKDVGRRVERLIALVLIGDA